MKKMQGVILGLTDFELKGRRLESYM